LLGKVLLQLLESWAVLFRSCSAGQHPLDIILPPHEGRKDDLHFEQEFKATSSASPVGSNRRLIRRGIVMVWKKKNTKNGALAQRWIRIQELKD